MDRIIDLAREIGAAIQQDDRYLRMMAAQEAADKDEALQGLIGEFNLKRIALGNEAQKEDRDEKKMESMNDELRVAYQAIMDNATMKAYNETKPEMDTLLNAVAKIITLSAQGEDPYSIDEHEEHHCDGSCSSCGGCH